MSSTALPRCALVQVLTRSAAAGGLKAIGVGKSRVPGQADGFHPVAARAVTGKTSMPE
jgi:hypothetical protein